MSGGVNCPQSITEDDSVVVLLPAASVNDPVVLIVDVVGPVALGGTGSGQTIGSVDGEEIVGTG